MRFLAIFIVAVATLYSGYWFVGSRAVENETRDALASLQKDGWIVDVDTVETKGFPSRFDTTLTNILIASPGDGFSYRAPFFQAFALSYAPNEVIAAFANEQKLRFGLQTLDVSTTGLRASASVQANTSASFGGLTAEVAEANVVSDFGWAVGLESAVVAMRPTNSLENTYDAYAEINALQMPAQVHELLSRGSNIPRIIEKTVFDARVMFDRQLDRHAISEIETSPPRPQSIELRSFAVIWGDMTLTGRGNVEIDANGIPTGQIKLSAVNWKQMIAVLAAARVIDPNIAPTVQNMADALAQGKETLSIPIDFQNGAMSVGPFPLGPAPRFF